METEPVQALIALFPYYGPYPIIRLEGCLNLPRVCCSCA